MGSYVHFNPLHYLPGALFLRTAPVLAVDTRTIHARYRPHLVPTIGSMPLYS